MTTYDVRNRGVLWLSRHKQRRLAARSKWEKRAHGSHKRWTWIARYGSVEAGIWHEMGLGRWLPLVEDFV